ncbi:MAG: mechanosensitive ion channel [Oscillospiraceae bacterium]
MKDKIWSFFSTYGEKIIGTVLILLVGLLLIKLFMKFLQKVFQKSKLDVTCHKFLLSLTKITLYILLIIITLSNLGINMTSLVTLVGVGGVAVGLAVQDSLSNIAGGFIILFTKPFEVGDFVELDGISGTVKHINILQTKLNTLDNKAVFIPNGQLSSAKIVNYSAEPQRRLDMKFSVSYDDDLTKVKNILLKIVNSNELSLKEPAPLVEIETYSESAVVFCVRVWTKTENYWNLNFAINEQIKIEFDKNSITIPFNQLEIKIKK